MKLLLTILTVLSSFLANLEEKTLQSAFTVTVAEEVNAPMNYPGTIVMHGRLFQLTMFGIEAAYDGKTMYMYNADTDELTLTNPTEQELLEANPLLYAKTVSEACHVTESKENGSSAKDEVTIITLTPKDKESIGGLAEGVSKIVLKVRNTDLMPMTMEMKEGKRTTTLRLNTPAFVESEPKYIIEPEATTYVNDMRL